MYLVDTNVWLERLLDQAGAGEVARFLERIPAEQLAISDFSFHSIGLILTRLGQTDALLRFVQDAFGEGPVSLLHLEAGDTVDLVDAMRHFKLDFDDAYQYAAAEKYGLTIVTCSYPLCCNQGR